jgi:uncharacterized secreted protein with C-terminal beta-propeller domain
MNDPIFRAMRDQMRPSPEVRDRLDQRLEERDGETTSGTGIPASSAGHHYVPAQPTRRRRTAGAWRWPAGIVGGVAAGAVLVLAIQAAWPGGRIGDIEVPADTVEAAPAPQAPGDASEPRGPLTELDRGIVTDDAGALVGGPVTDYGDLYRMIAEASTNSGDTRAFAPIADGAQAEAAPQEAPAPSGLDGDAAAMDAAGQAVQDYATSSDGGSGDYTTTNVQVEGIDEGDIVKTDGNYIYVGSLREVAVFEPLGAETREIARIDTAEAVGASGQGESALARNGTVMDMMITENRLAILVHEFAPENMDQMMGQSEFYVRFSASMTKTLLYDVSDPANPQFLAETGQSGAYRTSRLLGGVLYTVSTYRVPSSGIVEDDPATFAPLSLREGQRTVLPIDEIDAIAPAVSYAVASATDLESGTVLGERAVLGGAETVYMSTENLYLAAADYSGNAATVDSLTDGLISSQTAATHLIRIALNGGQLTTEAETTVSGLVLNQFAMDEYEGALRITLAVEGERSPSLTEWLFDGENTGGRWERWTALLVLDANLAVIGSVNDLAVGETVRSVRFSGPVGYVVTFRTMDPLFAIDLSTPTDPKVMSALKIPGFSTYLHPWGPGLLLGFGFAIDDNSWQEGLKLSMFDVSDPYDVTELATKLVEFENSPATSDHQAVWVDLSRNLIGFPVSSWVDGRMEWQFVVYSWTGEGFTQYGAADLASANEYTYDLPHTRAVRIGEFLYLCSAASVQVLAMDGMTEVASLTVNALAPNTIGYGEPIYW